jgi:multiple sugar transport system permease protein
MMRRTRKKIGFAIFELIMVVLALFWLYPYFWMTFSAFKPQNEIYTQFLPSRLTFENFKYIFDTTEQMDRDFLQALMNSIFISVTVTFSVVLTSAFVGYGIAKFKFTGGKVLKNFTIFQMLFPGFMFTIPTFVVVRSLGLLNTRASLIIPGLFGAWGVFMFTQSFRNVPNDYIEAARMEGASESRIVFSIMLPLSRSTASIVGLFTFIGIWDNFLTPLILIRDYDKMPLSVLLASFNHEYSTYIGPVLAGSVIQTLPMVILFLAFRKYFLQGISISFK